MSEIEIREIANSKKEIKKFVIFAEKVYKEYPNWVAPIYHDQIKFIYDGPFNKVGEKKLFMAYRDNQPVARVSAHISFAHNEHYNTIQGFFGFFEAFDDEAACTELFKAATTWLRDKKCSSMLGPMNFAIYDEIGMLTDAFDLDPVILCTYNPPYYPKILEKLGFVKEIDWYAFKKDGSNPLTPFMERIQKRIAGKKNVNIRNINLKEWTKEVNSVKDIFLEAWAENWGNVPLSTEQWNYTVDELKLVIKKELAFITEVDGQPVAFSITIPDANPALKKAKGRLFPFGIFKILWHMKFGKILQTRTMILGIREGYRRRGYDMEMIRMTIENGLRLGYMWSDCSLIVETNERMRLGMEALDGKIYKTYRIYKKTF